MRSIKKFSQNQGGIKLFECPFKIHGGGVATPPPPLGAPDQVYIACKRETSLSSNGLNVSSK